MILNLDALPLAAQVCFGDSITIFVLILGGFFFSGSINNQSYIGNIEHLWTCKKPEQKIPTFRETIEWFNRPENQHLQFNVRFMLRII